MDDEIKRLKAECEWLRKRAEVFGECVHRLSLLPPPNVTAHDVKQLALFAWERGHISGGKVFDLTGIEAEKLRENIYGS